MQLSPSKICYLSVFTQIYSTGNFYQRLSVLLSSIYLRQYNNITGKIKCLQSFCSIASTTSWCDIYQETLSPQTLGHHCFLFWSFSPCPSCVCLSRPLIRTRRPLKNLRACSVLLLSLTLLKKWEYYVPVIFIVLGGSLKLLPIFSVSGCSHGKSLFYQQHCFRNVRITHKADSADVKMKRYKYYLCTNFSQSSLIGGFQMTAMSSGQLLRPLSGSKFLASFPNPLLYCSL